MTLLEKIREMGKQPPLPPREDPRSGVIGRALDAVEEDEEGTDDEE